MAGAERFSAIIEAQTRGTAEVQKLEDALKRVADIAEKSGKRTGDSMKKATDDVSGSLDRLKGILQNPFQAATESAESFALSFGRVGLVAAGATTALAAAGVAAFSLASRVGELAEAQANASLITGLSIKEYGLYSQAAENAGLSSDALVGTMRQLSQVLSDNSEEGRKGKAALREYGISATDAFGALRPMSQILPEIADKLGAISNAQERVNVAQKILGRGALQALPLLNGELRGTLTELQKMGVGFDEFSAGTALRFDSALDRLTTRLKTFAKEAGVALAAAAGFEDPRKTQQNAANRARERAVTFELFEANRSGRDLTLGTADLFSATSGARSIGGSTVEQLQTQLTSSARVQIAALVEGKDAQSKLAAARKDLDEAIQAADVAAVKRLQANITVLEQRVKEESKVEVLRNKLAEFQVGTLGPNVNRSTRVPSLLNRNERQIRQQIAGQGSLNLPLTAVGSTALQLPTGGITQFNDEQRLAFLRQAVDLESQRISLVSTNEASAVMQIRDLRLSIAETDLERIRITKEAELEILRLKKQQRDEGRNTATSLFDAAVSGGQGLRSFITSQALAIPRTVAGNLGAEFGGLTGRFSLGLGGLPGRLLAGTPFGADPLKQAGDIQLTAAQLQLQAAQINSGRAAGTAGIAGAVGSVGSIFGGATGNPLIFNSLPSGRANQNASLAAMMAGLPSPTAFRSGPSGLTRGVGIAGLLGAGAFGAYSGYSAGGAQGVLTGTSSLAGTAAGLLPLLGVTGPAAPILGAAALGLGALAAILGNPKQKRADALARDAESRRFTEPTGADYTSDIYGRSIGYDYSGRMRPVVIYQDHRQTHISAIDPPSFVEWARRNPDAIAEANTAAIQSGNAEDMLKAISQATA